MLKNLQKDFLDHVDFELDVVKKVNLGLRVFVSDPVPVRREF